MQHKFILVNRFFAQDTMKKEKEERRTVYEDFSNHEATRTCMALGFLLVGMYFIPFLFMGSLKDYLCLPWFGPVVCQASCPYQSCECRLPSIES